MSGDKSMLEVEPRDLQEQITISNQLQAAKVNTLMKSINKLQKENLSLQKGSREVSRTKEYKKIQDELGQQDILIDVLRYSIGAAKSQELMLHAIESLERDRPVCSSCSCDEEELLKCEAGFVLCRRCYGKRFWKEAPASVERLKASQSPKYPNSKEKLQRECQALEVDLANARRMLKATRTPSKNVVPKSASFNTAAALTNILAGYVQRADQLEKENVSLKNHREQLEKTLGEQEHEHKQQIQQHDPVEPEKRAASGEDLQTRIRLRKSEIGRATQALAETRQKLLDQTSKQEALRTEINAAQGDIKTLQEEMTTWFGQERVELAKQLDHIQHSKDQRKKHLQQSREKLKETKAKLRKSLRSIGDQRTPLEVQSRIKAQARTLHLALRHACESEKNEKKGAWSEFWMQLEVERGKGLEVVVEELLGACGVQDSEKTIEKLQELQEALYHMEVASDASAAHLGSEKKGFGRWSDAKKKLQDDFRAKAWNFADDWRRTVDLTWLWVKTLNPSTQVNTQKTLTETTQDHSGGQPSPIKVPLALTSTSDLRSMLTFVDHCSLVTANRLILRLPQSLQLCSSLRIFFHSKSPRPWESSLGGWTLISWDLLHHYPKLFYWPAGFQPFFFAFLWQAAAASALPQANAQSVVFPPLTQAIAKWQVLKKDLQRALQKCDLSLLASKKNTAPVVFGILRILRILNESEGSECCGLRLCNHGWAACTPAEVCSWLLPGRAWQKPLANETEVLLFIFPFTSFPNSVLPGCFRSFLWATACGRPT